MPIGRSLKSTYVEAQVMGRKRQEREREEEKRVGNANTHF